MRILLILIAVVWTLFALEPVRTIPLPGSAIDAAVTGGILVTGGDAGTVSLLRLGENKPFESIKLPPIEGLFGPRAPKIYAVDRNEKGALLWIAEGRANEGRALTLREPNGAQRVLIGPQERRLLRKARFVPGGIFAVEVGGIARLITLEGTERYAKAVMGSSFSDFALSPDGREAALCGESGEVIVLDIATGEIRRRFKGGNLDNVYRIDWKGEYLITAGQDRLAVVYHQTGGAVKKIPSSFLISAAALSPSGNRLAYVSDESGAISVHDRDLGTLAAVLKGHFAMVGILVFTDENRLITGGDDNFLLEWRIP